MKVFVVAVLCIAVCVAEPPVNTYLPPSGQSAHSGPPSGLYGVPNDLSAQYGAPSALSTQYGAPSAFNNFDDSIVVSARSQGHNVPSASYGAPLVSRKSSFGAAGRSGFAHKSSISHGVHGFGSARGGLATTYGAPNAHSRAAFAPSPVYGVPGYAARAGRDFDDQSEPAHYNFEYNVNDEYGNDFGHEETRDEDQAWGRYSVVLPDGRKQIVEYQANEEGFKPKISYEEGYAKSGSGYGRGAGGYAGAGGYHGAGGYAGAGGYQGAGGHLRAGAHAGHLGGAINAGLGHRAHSQAGGVGHNGGYSY